MNHEEQNSGGIYAVSDSNCPGTQQMGMESQNDSPDLTHPCELNAVPWTDLIEKRQLLDGLDSMLMAPLSEETLRLRKWLECVPTNRRVD